MTAHVTMEDDGVQGYCAIHPSKPATSFCVQHRQSMCIACLLTNHKHCIDHVQAIDTTDTDDIVVGQTSSSELERICDRLSTNVSDVKNRKSAWIDNLGKVEKDLIVGLRTMRHRIVQKADRLCTEAIDMTRSVLKEHNKMYEADIEDLLEFQHRLKEIKRRLYRVKSQSELEASERQLEKIRREFDQRNMKSGDIKVHFHVSEMVSRFEAGLDTFGELCVEDVTERVRSLYLSPSEIQRLSTDLLQQKTKPNTEPRKDKQSLFVTNKDDDPVYLYRKISPSSDGSGSPIIWPATQQCPPPLPTMENRLLSPPIITLNPPQPTPHQQEVIGKDKRELHETNEASDTSDVEEVKMEQVSDEWQSNEDGEGKTDAGDDLSIPSLPSKSKPNSMISLGDYSTPDAMFFQPNISTDNDFCEKTVKEEYSQPAPRPDAGKLAIPKLPRRHRAPLDSDQQASGTELKDTPTLRNGHITRDGHARYKQSQTLPRPQKQQTRKHSHETDDSLSPTNNATTERPVSNFRNCSDGCYSASSGRDSGIALSQELSISKTRSAGSTQLTIPKLPTRDPRKLSDPFPCPARQENVDTNKHQTEKDVENPAYKKNASETDIRFPHKHDNADVTYIRAMEKDPDVDIKNTDMPFDNHEDFSSKIKERVVKSVGTPTSRNNYQIIYADIILDASSQKNKARTTTLITSMSALGGGYILVCDYRNNVVEMYDSYGLLKDSFGVYKPFGCCRTAEDRFAVTSRDPPKISMFVTEGSRMKHAGERLIDTASDVFGISFSYGFFCLSCQTEVKLLRDQCKDQETQIQPMERKGRPRGTWFNKSRPAKPYFSDVQYAIMERLGDRFYIFTSDMKKRRVTSVGLSGIVIWDQSNIESRTLAYYNQQVLVATDRQVVLLHAATGVYIRAIRAGIPRNPWSLAVDEDLFPCLMVSGSGKTCARRVTRVALEAANEHLLTEVHYV